MQLLIFVLLYPVGLLAAPSSSQETVEQFLKEIVTESKTLKSSDLRRQQHLLKSEARQFIFDAEGFAGLDRVSQENPPSSPFAPSKVQKSVLKTGVSKLFPMGVRTSLNYELTDETTEFTGRDNLEYYQPTISLRAESNLFSDLFGERYALIDPLMEQEKKQADLTYALEKKRLLGRALLDLAQVLEMQDEQVLTKKLCRQTSRQTDYLEKRNKRGSINKRQLLISKKELNRCNSLTRQQKRDLLMRSTSMETSYHIDPKPYLSLRVDDFFSSLKGLFKAAEQSSNFDIKADLEYQTMKNRLTTLKTQYDILLEESQPDVTLSVATGIMGAHSDIGEAHSEALKANYPFVSLGVSTKIPWQNRQLSSQLRQNRLEAKAQEEDLAHMEQQKTKNFDVLKETIEADHKIYRSQLKNVDLSRQIMDDAEKDFNIGRLDYNELAEFQKAYVDSRRQLGRLRLQIVIKTVEYLDHFGFFSSY